MAKNILVILGHPAHQRESFCEALANAYSQGATESGHRVEQLKLADLQFDPLLHEGYEGEGVDGVQPPEPDILAAQENIRAAEHLVFVHPMWQFQLPALVKGFCERTLTKGFAYDRHASNPLRSGLLTGKSAHIIQTMGMPGWFYALWYRAHGAKALRDMLRFIGIKPVHCSYFGLVEKASARQKHLARCRELGVKGK